MQLTYIISTILAILALLFGFILNSRSSFNDQLYNKSLPKEYMKKLTVYNYSSKGILKSSVSADYWELLINHDFSIMEKPAFIIYQNPEVTYNINAKFGNIEHLTCNKIDLIKLTEVMINKKYYNSKKSDLTLITKELFFDPKTEIANTEKLVTISQYGLLTSAKGMIANLKLNQLELNKHVLTTYKKID